MERTLPSHTRNQSGIRKVLSVHQHQRGTENPPPDLNITFIIEAIICPACAVVGASACNDGRRRDRLVVRGQRLGPSG